MPEQSAGPGRLGPICCVTITAPDLNAVEHAYVNFLQFRVVARGKISDAVAILWGCPGAAGRSFL
jgi:hypothetical protein